MQAGITTKAALEDVNVTPILSNSTADAGAAIFAPANHLLGIVQGIVASRDNARIFLPGIGEIVIFPERSEYRANVRDMAEFCRAPAAQFVVTVISATAISEFSSPGRNIKDLLWQAAFHASQGFLVEGCSKYDVVQFRHWPNLTRLPTTQHTARVCALLTRHPTTIMLVQHILGIGKEEVCQIYSAAYCAGIAQRISRNPDSGGDDALAADAKPEPAQERSLFRSLFAKISGL